LKNLTRSSTSRPSPIAKIRSIRRPSSGGRRWKIAGRAAIIRVTLPALKRPFPEIVDMNLPFEGVFHNLTPVSIRKQYPVHARKILKAIRGIGRAMFTKCIVVVDEDVNV
jgi:UbiD family decarboxylase